MKILCLYSHCGPAFVRQGWGHVLSAMGHQFVFWDPATKPAFDIFSEFEPDIFLGTTYDVDRATYKCLASRPHIKVVLYASAWGKLASEIPQTYPITRVMDKEKEIIEKLKKETGKPDFVWLHLTDSYVEPVLGGWNEIGVNPKGMLNAADTFDYLNGRHMDEFSCHIAFVGGYWGYKSINLNKYILPLCRESKYKIKIFGNQPWPVPHYLGFIDNHVVKDIFASAVICPNVSEPHSTDFHYDIVERPFKVLAAGGFCISDYVGAMEKEVFTNNEVPFAKSPKEFVELIDYFLTNPEKRVEFIQRGQKTVFEKHTYFNRVADMFKYLGMPEEEKKVVDLHKRMLNL